MSKILPTYDEVCKKLGKGYNFSCHADRNTPGWGKGGKNWCFKNDPEDAAEWNKDYDCSMSSFEPLRLTTAGRAILKRPAQQVKATQQAKYQYAPSGLTQTQRQLSQQQQKRKTAKNMPFFRDDQPQESDLSQDEQAEWFSRMQQLQKAQQKRTTRAQRQQPQQEYSGWMNQSRRGPPQSSDSEEQDPEWYNRMQQLQKAEQKRTARAQREEPQQQYSGWLNQSRRSPPQSSDSQQQDPEWFNRMQQLQQADKKRAKRAQKQQQQQQQQGTKMYF